MNDLQTYERYKPLVPPTLALYGGEYLARSGNVHVLEGTWQPERLVVVRFPDAEAAKRWWNSSEYADAKAMRHRAARTNMVIVEGPP